MAEEMSVEVQSVGNCPHCQNEITIYGRPGVGHCGECPDCGEEFRVSDVVDNMI